MSSKVINLIPQKIKRLNKNAQQWTRDGADELLKEIKKQAAEPKHGKKYGKRISSAPGEPWANQSRDSIKSFKKSNRLMETTLGSNLWRVEAFEKDGIQTRRAKIAARPTIAPALERIKPFLKTSLAEAARKSN